MQLNINLIDELCRSSSEEKIKVRSRKIGIFFPIPKNFKQRSGMIIHSVQKGVLESRVEDISCDGQTEGKMLGVHFISS